jgi:hypothetical protein
MAVAAMASLCGLRAGEDIKGLSPIDDAALAALGFMIPGMVIGLIVGGLTAPVKHPSTPPCSNRL